MNCSDISTTTVKTISHNRSICWLAFKNNLLDLEYLHPEITKQLQLYNLVNYPLIFMIIASLPFKSFSIFSMVSNNEVLLAKTAAKQTNTITAPNAEQMHSIYSVKPLATWEAYTNCEIILHPDNKKPKQILSLNEWLDELMPKTA